MGNNRVVVLVLAAMLSTFSLTGYASDELSDTQTAAKHVEQGIAFLKANNIDAAISEFEKSNEMLPDAEASYYLGYAYYLKGRKDDGESRKKSLEYFEQAYEIDPNFSPAGNKLPEPAPSTAPQEQEQASSPEAIVPQPAPSAEPAPAAEPTTPAPSSEQQKP